MLDMLGGLFGRKHNYLERRALVRLPCKIQAQLSDGATEMTVAVSDISLKGIRVESPEKLAKGKQVKVLGKGANGGPVQCKVLWAKQVDKHWSCGLEYSDSQQNMATSWVKEALLKLGFTKGKASERRKHLRLPASTQVRAALANLSGDVLTDGMLINLGAGGALVAVKVEVPPGTRVRIQIDPIGVVAPLDITGVIRSAKRNVRSQNYYHGIRFDVAEDPLVKKYLQILMKGRA